MPVMKKFDLNDKIVDAIINFAKKFNLSKVILFGSRARCDNKPRSDIDLAVIGGDVLEFKFAMDEELPTLLEVDVINLADKLNSDFLAEIERDGVILYEKI